ncbi:hypothetical protein CRM22_002519 [Opisthorchis felineus]|uniref:Uncharacterized protein n=1 Tax=Opisthorchis felineus TaxID=147828 RepID=A0A4S2M5K5_OPIFE|nr:hypothetical protein CRM22_002519 [Opisthorchis felineus]
MFTYSLARQDSVILRSEKTLTAIVSGLKLGTLKSGPFPVLAQLFGSLHTKAGRALEASSNIRIFVAIRYDRGLSSAHTAGCDLTKSFYEDVRTAHECGSI